MRKIAFILGLGLFLLLAACNQTPTTDLSSQGLEEYGQVRLNVVSDYREDLEETNFNGQWDKGEFLVPDVEIMLTPIDEKGNIIGEPIRHLTGKGLNPQEAKLIELPVGLYLSELKLSTKLQGGDEYAWKSDLMPLPPLKIDPDLLTQSIYSIACGFRGSQYIEIKDWDSYYKSPCGPAGVVEDSLFVSANPVVIPCDGQSVQTDVSIGYRSTPSPVTLSASNLPAGMTASFNSATTSISSTLTLSISGIAAGDYTIMLQDSRGVSLPVTVKVRGVTVNFPDAYLLNDVRTALKIPAPTTICSGDMLALTRLNAEGMSNIEGLQYAKNLVNLKISGGNVSTINLNPLSNLAKLETLDLHMYGYFTVDFSPISTLPNLYYLYLTSVSADLTPLTTLPKFTHLYLYRSHQVNIEVLSDQLTHIGTNNCPFGYINLNALANFTKLESVVYRYSCLSSLAPLALANLSTLREILVPGGDIRDLSDFVRNGGMPNGGVLDLTGNPLGLSDPHDPDHENIAILERRGVRVIY
jgi:hypothetical protein